MYIEEVDYIILRKYDPLPEILNRVETLKEMITEETNYTPVVTKMAVDLLNELEKILNNA